MWDEDGSVSLGVVELVPIAPLVLFPILLPGTWMFEEEEWRKLPEGGRTTLVYGVRGDNPPVPVEYDLRLWTIGVPSTKSEHMEERGAARISSVNGASALNVIPPMLPVSVAATLARALGEKDELPTIPPPVVVAVVVVAGCTL